MELATTRQCFGFQEVVVTSIDRSTLNFRYEITLDRLVADQKGKDCFVQFQSLGFTAANWVALKTHVSTWYDDGDTPEDKPADKVCKEKTQMWAVEPATEKWHSLPANFMPARYAQLGLP
jgi:hypothetical protein